jgi:hypothetical protein
MVKGQGFFWPDFIAEIRLCSQSQKVYFFPKMWQKIPIKKNYYFFFFFFFKEVSNAYFISILIQLHLTKYYMNLFSQFHENADKIPNSKAMGCLPKKWKKNPEGTDIFV